ncbi:hypothetical protein RND71_034538 [Anisodus tanguticus]|uniref:Uncharacterized protein n=1 Tax=Anisodus tanguticus TaxID=243964 RepID=A0AAE1RBH2_9SOLA|nr:hypothetical protein RND71_034538 [Anisodus tanguticus]
MDLGFVDLNMMMVVNPCSYIGFSGTKWATSNRSDSRSSRGNIHSVNLQTKDLRSPCVLALCTGTAEFEAARRTSPITELSEQKRSNEKMLMNLTCLLIHTLFWNGDSLSIS